MPIWDQRDKLLDLQLNQLCRFKKNTFTFHFRLEREIHIGIINIYESFST